MFLKGLQLSILVNVLSLTKIFIIIQYFLNLSINLLSTLLIILDCEILKQLSFLLIFFFTLLISVGIHKAAYMLVN